MGVHERRARHKTLLRQEILDAAREILVKEGFGRLTMRRVADKIDYSPTAIYLHFATKKDLIFSVCEETFAKLNRELEVVAHDVRDPLAALKKGLRTYVDFGLRHPEYYLPTFVMPHDATEGPTQSQPPPDPASLGMRAFTSLARRVAECVQQGKIRKVDVEATSRVLWAGVHGITSLLIVHPAFPWGDRDKVIDLLIESITDGLKT